MTCGDHSDLGVQEEQRILVLLHQVKLVQAHSGRLQVPRDCHHHFGVYSKPALLAAGNSVAGATREI
jgi:hypothetical protein